VTATQSQTMQQAMAAYQRGNLDEAQWLCRQALGIKPDDFDALNLSGIIAIRMGRVQEAAGLLGRAVAVKPADAATRINYGATLQELQRPAEALEQYQHAIRLNPDIAGAHNNLGFALRQLGRLDEALASYDRAVQLKPDYAEAFNNRGIALQEQKRLELALASYDQALALRPDYAEAHNNRGSALQRLRRLQAALDSYERAIALLPNFAEAFNNRGIVLKELARLDEALESYAHALRLAPDHAQAHNNRGVVLRELRRPDEALASHEQALRYKPDHAEAHNNRGIALRELGRLDEALASYERALAILPDYAGAHHNRGNALRQVGRYPDAAQSFARALAAAPDFSFAKGHLLHVKMLCCDWNGLDELHASLQQDCLARKPSADPFGYQAICDSEHELQICAEVYAATYFPRRGNQVRATAGGLDRRIRLGYLSGEFRHQATSLLMTELFERHDRNRFESFAFDNGGDDGSQTRARINAAFREVIDITRMSDPEAAALVQSRGIDILVNLNGYFGEGRQGVFAHKPSPIQVNYLGFPGTLGADYIDYLIADRTVIPAASRQYYSEKIAWLPDCYQANDTRRAIADRMFTREELGLPRTGFVFCCFSNNYKITPGAFDGWMRILDRVDRSVLWLLENNSAASANLRQEASARGVNPERLIFAAHMPLEEHLARHRAADLFLDTWPCNAHTTASDALWAGLPLLTCAGHTFPGRVAASLLEAIGMSELIASTPEHYEALAVEIADHPEKLAHLRQKLVRNRLTTPLFDVRRFTGHIENAYAQMYERYQAGLPPDHILVSS
jgi:protein O-GlcNAc transferase